MMWIENFILPANGSFQAQPTWIPASSGPTPFDPSLYGTPVEWLIGDDNSVGIGNPITSWPFNTYGVNGVTSGGSPLSASGPNGHLAVRYNGASDYSLASITVPSGTFFLVVKENTHSDFTGYLCSSKAGSADTLYWAIHQGSSGANGSQLQAFSQAAINASSLSGYKLLTARCAPDLSIEFFQNGVSQGTQTTAFIPTDADGTTIGCRYFVTPSFFASCDIAEILLYSDKLTGSNLAAVTSYLQIKYAL